MASISPVRKLGSGEATRFFWRAQPMGWLFLATIGFCIRYAAYGNAGLAFGLTAILDTLGFIVTSGAAILHVRYAGSVRKVSTLVIAALLCVCAAALFGQIASAIHGAFPRDAVAYVPRNWFALAFIYNIGIFSIWTLVYFAVSAELDARSERMSKMRAETRALQMELEHLQRQIEPHFLFNSLNTILGEIAERPAIAEEMTRRLADYLRYSLSKRDSSICSLEEEIAAVENYIGIQALRFDERFTYRCDMDPASLGIGIPHMTLQGLVENAIKHGMRADQTHFAINVRSRVEGAALVIDVDNPGVLSVPFEPSQAGVGLTNMYQRLALRYPGRHSFALQQREGRTVATLILRGNPCLV
jgi:hypothetical protein